MKLPPPNTRYPPIEVRLIPATLALDIGDVAELHTAIIDISESAATMVVTDSTEAGIVRRSGLKGRGERVVLRIGGAQPVYGRLEAVDTEGSDVVLEVSFSQLRPLTEVVPLPELPSRRAL